VNDTPFRSDRLGTVYSVTHCLRVQGLRFADGLARRGDDDVCDRRHALRHRERAKLGKEGEAWKRGRTMNMHDRSSRLVMLMLGVIVEILLGSSLRHLSAQSTRAFDAARRRMVDEEIIGGGIKNQRVIDAVLATKRHEFVAAKYRDQAYLDMSLPIGGQQTISSPFIVSYMTESLDPQPGDKVLEIGTGSGYQAAILSPLVKEVYTIEIVEELGKRASRTLKRLGYQNVFTKVGDGFQGWAEHAPFDKIVVTCSPEDVPQPLIDQLKEGGRMVIPVGERYQQTLYLYTKVDGRLSQEALRPTLFVPMTGAAEENRDVQPDPANPQVVNGDFEQSPGKNGTVAGWYYERQYRLVDDEQAPQGKQFVRFENSEPGRGSRMLQGFAIDGRKVAQLTLTAMVRTQDIRQGPENAFPYVAVSFYDQDRKQLGLNWLGPWVGTHAWNRESSTFRVPPQAREGILRIGLFGATGIFDLDDIRMEVNQAP
jgi:protein-L-isoaspartate(D-aspartate) O-methyltransferase